MTATRKKEIFLDIILCYSVEQKGGSFVSQVYSLVFSRCFWVKVSLEKIGDYSRADHGELSI